MKYRSRKFLLLGTIFIASAFTLIFDSFASYCENDIELTDLSNYNILSQLIRQNKIEKLEEILKDPNYIEAYLNAQDNEGNTPLHVASQIQNIEACKLLINNGAKPDIRNNTGIYALDYIKDNDVKNELIGLTNPKPIDTQTVAFKTISGVYVWQRI